LVYKKTGSYNVAVGNSAGSLIQTFGNLTAATNSIFIGYLTRASGNNQTNQIVIGDQALGLGSNTTVIGNSSTTLFKPYGNLILGNPYIPTGSTDPTGTSGMISWSGNTIYLRNSTGWVRFTGETF